MIEIYKLQEEILNKSYELKKELGQYFTDQNISNYMATMIHENVSLNKEKELRILDAGAGTGILSISAIMRCIELGYKNINVTLYEIDSALIESLNNTMQYISMLLKDKINFKFLILNEDFVLRRPDKNKEKFHLSIINPPYFKYSAKESKYSQCTSDLFKGDPNIYASFMAIVINSLEKKGQMIAIVPRSFTNGLYFKNFRTFLEEISSLEIIHIFKSRNNLFKKNKVLQENIICKFVKNVQSKEISIISSNTIEDINNAETNIYDSSFIIDKADNFSLIHIPETNKDAEIMTIANNLDSTFSKEGYIISTGKVVSFRNRELLEKRRSSNSIPLYKASNVKKFHINWNEKEEETYFRLVEDHSNLTIKNDLYLLLRRFSSKDEKKRLVAALLFPNINDESFAIDNKLNYISKRNSSLEKVEAIGLCALLNSTFMDNYFRCFSGNTQVNATEIRIMRFPKVTDIIKIGNEILFIEDTTQENIDKIINKYILKV
jgi:adenine-specific DNA-methyltransferase